MNQDAAGSLLREVARLFGQLQRESIACCGTTSTQCTILTELGRHGPGTLADLSRRLGLDKGWASRAVEQLVQEGLLTKVPGQEDRRTVTIALTAEGEARFHDLNRTLNGQAGRVLGRIPPENRGALVLALEQLQHALKAEVEGGPVPLFLEEDLR